jgi:hypothetical protein
MAVTLNPLGLSSFAKAEVGAGLPLTLGGMSA